MTRVTACLGVATGVTAMLLACHNRDVAAWNARVARFEARLKEPGAGYRSQTSLGLAGLVVPRVEVSRPLEAGAVVSIMNSELLLNGRRLGPVDSEITRATLTAQLTRMAPHHAGQGPSKQTDVYFMLAPEVASATLMEMVAVLPPSMPARLLVRHGDVVKIDPVPKGASEDARQEIERLLSATGTERVTAFAEAVRRNLQPCGPARAAFGRVARADAEEKEGILVRDLPRALERCPYGVNIDVVEGVFVAMLTPAGPPMGWLPLELDQADTEAAPIGLAKYATVGQLATALSDVEHAGHRSYLVPAAAHMQRE